MDAKIMIQDMERTYEKVQSLAGWMVDKSVVLTITSYYVATDRKFVPENLNRAMDSIKRKAGWLSPLRGNLLPVMGAFLDKPNSNIDEEVDALFAKQRLLRTVGFRNTVHCYLAALLLTDEVEDYTDEVRQAKMLFDEMKKRHYFLTSDNDYAYVVLLSKKGAPPAAHAEAIRTYYDALRSEKFRSGNHLQWMAQIMTCMSIEFDEALVKRAKESMDFFRSKVKVSPIHYPMIGFLAIFHVKHSQLEEILHVATLLQSSKIFSRRREMALSMAIGSVVRKMTENDIGFDITFATSIEYILQAQKAVMIATIATFAATASANSSKSSQ